MGTRSYGSAAIKGQSGDMDLQASGPLLSQDPVTRTFLKWFAIIFLPFDVADFFQILKVRTYDWV